MSDDTTDVEWWPEGYRHPAFEVRRRRYGFETKGGDYTRGSAGYHSDPEDDESEILSLPHTALRFPTKALDPTAFDITARGLMFAQAYDYDTIKLIFHLPTSVYDTFKEMSIVRSTFGAPREPMQGVTIFKRKRSDFAQVDGHLIPPVIYDEFVPPKVPDKNRPGKFIDGVLPSGHWYYYTAFFTTNNFDWAPMMSDQCLLPRNYNHADHLWNSIPPYYQWADDTYNGKRADDVSANKNFLKRFLTIFGFELDRTREYVESLLKLHWADQVPVPLLKQLGANYGFGYEEGLGDVRYRALIANISYMLTTRGTATGLLELIETVSKYDCDVTEGVNNVLVADDSNFINSTGHWAPIHPDIPFTIPDVAWPLWMDVTLKVNPAKGEPGYIDPPMLEAPGSAGSMSVQSLNGTDTTDLFITAGAGIFMTGPTEPNKEFIPYYHGIPVNPGTTYGMSAWIKAASAVQVFAYFIPFTAKGQIIDVCVEGPMAGLAAVRPVPPNENDWFMVEMVGTLPIDCEYLVPALLFKDRATADPIHVAAVMVYKIVIETGAVVTAPDRYLTLGNPNEKLGATTDDDGTGHPYEGFVIGSPARRAVR